MLFNKFALTKPNPSKAHSAGWLGYITVYLPDGAGKLGDIQASMSLSGDGIGVSNSSGGEFTTKFGIRTELKVDELKTLSEFLMARGSNIAESLAVQDKLRRVYIMTEPFGNTVKAMPETVTTTVPTKVKATKPKASKQLEFVFA